MLPHPQETPSSSACLVSVLGEIPAQVSGAVDAHSHIWIERVRGAAPDAPILDEPARILLELRDYLAAGGSALIDCQPGYCGRNGNWLAQLSQQSGVTVIGCTGFHLRRYYGPEAAIWSKDENQLTRFFVSELRFGMEETLANPNPVRAGFIKIAIEAALQDTPQPALAAAAAAARETSAALEIHTEKGAQAEQVVDYFVLRGVAPAKILLCHVDKRPDHGLHVELARAGVMLEYDTFYRSKYDPETNLWPLIDHMLAAGCSRSLALATDLAESRQWRAYGGQPGLAAFPSGIPGRLAERGASQAAIRELTGGNIIRFMSTQALTTPSNMEK